MDKLAIVKMVNALAGTQGSIDSVETVSGYQTLLVTFVDNAYKDIQTYRSTWKFLQEMVQMPLTTILSTYSSTDIADVRYLIYDKRRLIFVEYEAWILRDWTTGKPGFYTVNPGTDEITVNPLDASYIIDLYYFQVPQVMTASTDTPSLPIRFHQLIVYKALIDLGTYLGNYDLIQMYSTKYSYELGEIMRSQIAQTRVSSPSFVPPDRWYV